MNHHFIALLSACSLLASFSLAADSSFDPLMLSSLQTSAKNGIFHSGWIPLGTKAADLKERQISPGHITDVGEAQLQIYFPSGWEQQDKRTALCIFPGGGYVIQAIEKEGCHIAQWAAENGMVAIVVKYRVSEKNNAIGKFPGPLLDARYALRYVRKNASSLGIEPTRIGVMGFSAGAHLAAMTSTLWAKELQEETSNPLKNISARPNFSMLIYPVITMNSRTTHLGTRHKILGNAPSTILEELCSAELQVTEQTPPVFLVQAQDDFVSCNNSKLMEQKCREKGVPVSLKLYTKGGHGYGMEKRNQPTDQWPEDAKHWLKEQKLLPANSTNK